MLTNMSAQLPPSSTSASSKAAPPSASDGSVAMSASVAVLPPLPISKYTLRSSLFASRNFTSRKFRLWRRAFWTTLPIEEADEDQQRIALQDCKIMRFLSVLKTSQRVSQKTKKREKKEYKCRQNTHTVGDGKRRREDKGGKEMTKRRRTPQMWTFAARDVTKTQQRHATCIT